jgi:hypothetical protein
MKKTKKFGMGGAMPALVGKKPMGPAPTPMGIPNQRIMNAINGGAPVPNRQIRQAVRQDNNMQRMGTKPMVKGPMVSTPLPPPVTQGLRGANPIDPNRTNPTMPKQKSPELMAEEAQVLNSQAGNMLKPTLPPVTPKPMGMKKGGQAKASPASKRGDGCAIKGKTKGRFV